MKLVVARDYDHMSDLAAELVAEEVSKRPQMSIVAATGNSPMGLYARLASLRASGRLQTTSLRIFQLDEYLDEPPRDARSLFAWLQRSVAVPLAIQEHQITRLEGVGRRIHETCRRFDVMIDEAGGFDLAVLGLGPNGHLGYNEPPADPTLRTHPVDLTDSSLRAAGSYWRDDVTVPRHAVTVGLADLLSARRILLLVSGEGKADILARTLKGPVTPDVPASYLQGNPALTVIAERAAASMLVEGSGSGAQPERP
ncbi:MAG TPA: glucosamine-6-phosphate deaminase [Chloroflexota bacterium]|nr:glucosamine-6-phosphate deaminase [Chloroflexota bacterium]